MSLRLTALVVCALLSASLMAQEEEEHKPPVQIRSITLHEEGKEARTVDVERAPRDIVSSGAGELDGNWWIANDTGGGLSVENRVEDDLVFDDKCRGSDAVEIKGVTWSKWDGKNSITRRTLCRFDEWDFFLLSEIHKRE